MVGITKVNQVTGQLDMKGPKMEDNWEQGITLKTSNTPKAMDMEKGMVLRKKRGQVRFINQMVLRVKFIMLPKDQEKVVSISQLRVPKMDKVGMEEMGVEMIKRNTKTPGMTLRIRKRKRVIQKTLMSWRSLQNN